MPALTNGGIVRTRDCELNDQKERVQQLSPICRLGVLDSRGRQRLRKAKLEERRE